MNATNVSITESTVAGQPNASVRFESDGHKYIVNMVGGNVYRAAVYVEPTARRAGHWREVTRGSERRKRVVATARLAVYNKRNALRRLYNTAFGA